MKKSLLLLPVLLVAGCAQVFDDNQDEISYYDGEDAVYDEVVEPIDTNSGLSVRPDPEQENYQQTVWQEEDRQIPSRSVEGANQWQEQPQPQPQASISADGTYIEIPAQKIYLNQNTQTTGGVPQPVTADQRKALPPMAYSQPGSAQMPQPGQGSQAAVYQQPYQMQQQAQYVTLQSPIRPNTYAQCPPTNADCISYYEQQGYRRVPGIPQFAGYQEVPATSDYPGNGRWRNTNNVPRW